MSVITFVDIIMLVLVVWAFGTIFMYDYFSQKVKYEATLMDKSLEHEKKRRDALLDKR